MENRVELHWQFESTHGAITRENQERLEASFKLSIEIVIVVVLGSMRIQ